MKKSFKAKKWVLLTALFAVCLLMKPVKAEAASYKKGDEYTAVKIGKTTVKMNDHNVYAIRNGKRITFSSKKAKVVNFITNGKEIIYSTSTGKKSCVYQANIAKKTQKLLFNHKGYVSVADKSGNKLYFDVEYYANNDYAFKYYNLKSKKTKVVKKERVYDRTYRGKIYLTEIIGEAENITVYQVDMKTGKAKKLLTGCEIAFSGKTIYYTTVIWKNGESKETLYKCSINGKNKKKLGAVRSRKNGRIYYKTKSGKAKATPKLK